MTVLSFERRLQRLEAARFQTDRAIAALTDEELATALRDASDDPGDHALVDWFEAGDDAPLPAIAFEALQRSLR